MAFWTPALTRLRDHLAALYPAAEDAGRVLDEVGIPRARIDLSGTPQLRWHAIVSEAQKLGRIDDLVGHATAEYRPSGAPSVPVAPPVTPRAPRRKVLILYGGEAATNPRHELLAWLRGPDFELDARIVADEAAHSGGAVDDRVDAMIAWADVAIALVTPDARSPHGAPNVIDEIGRWRGGRGKASLCIVRQKGVEPYSNHAGLVYVGFEGRVREAFEGIRRFLASVDTSKTDGGDAAPARTASPPREVTIEDSGDLVLLDTLAVEPASVVERADEILIELPGLSSEHEGTARRILASRRSVSVAYGNTATLVELTHHEFRRVGGKAAVQITARPAKRSQNWMPEMVVAVGGRQYAPAEVAQMRARRILLDDPPAIDDRTSRDIVESVVRGNGALGPVRQSSVPELLRQLPAEALERWRLVRLFMILHLRLSDCVEHVDLLRLTVRDGVLVRVTFRGTRAALFGSVPPDMIEVDGAPCY